MERFSELNHLRQAIDVAPVNDKIETKRNAGCADLRGNIQLVLMRTSPGDFISKICVVRLKTQLDRVQARIAQSAQTIVIQTDAAGDEVRVKVCLACCANQIGQVTPGEWRSEEHTSELQSQSNLVCRLLLE